MKPKQDCDPPKDDNSPQVVAYRVGQLEKVVSEGFDKLHAKLDELRDGFVTHEQLSAYKEQVKTEQDAACQADRLEHEAFTRRIVKLENWQTWLIRLVVGAVVLSILSIVLADKVIK